MIIKDTIISVKKYNWGPYWNYQVTHPGGVSGVPNDPDNSDYQTVLEWASVAGNDISPADN